MEWLKLVHEATTHPSPPAPRPGDEVRVWFKILEQGKERLGQFEGTVLRARGSSASKTFTVRRVTYGEGVERVFPVDSKTISRIEVLRRGQAKRARLYFLRTAVGKTRLSSADASGSSNSARTPAEAAQQPSAAAPIAEGAADATHSPERSEGAVAAADQSAGRAAAPHA